MLTSSDALRTQTTRISLQIVTSQFKQLIRHMCIVYNFVHLSADNFEKWCVFKVVECMCGVIWENPHYGGITSLGFDQTSPVLRGESPDCLSFMNIYIEHFCRCLCSFIHKYYPKRVKAADLY